MLCRRSSLLLVLLFGCADGPRDRPPASPPDAGPTSDASVVDAGAVEDGGADAGAEDAGAHDAGALPEYGQLELRSAFAEGADVQVRTQGIFAIWWDSRFEHDGDVPTLFGRLETIRADCITRLGMADPPNPGAGYFYNVYIHHGADDVFPEGWGNGQGTDRFGMPFLTLPPGPARQGPNIGHEGFHIFQYSANAPGFAYRGDSQWFVETTAQYYSASLYPDDLTAFVEVGALAANPQLTMWHSFGNAAPDDPADWNYQVRQYGMHALLFYLENEAGVSPAIFTEGFYSGTTLSPQEYLRQGIGEGFAGYFADWAAHNTGGFDYLDPDQVARARAEIDNVGDPETRNPFAAELGMPTADEPWRRPEVHLPRSWSYNVVRVEVTESTELLFELQGDATGSEGAASRFLLRAVAVDELGVRYAQGSNDTDAQASLTVGSGEGEVFFVIVSVPEHYSGNQTYGYEYRVTAN